MKLHEKFDLSPGVHGEIFEEVIFENLPISFYLVIRFFVHSGNSSMTSSKKTDGGKAFEKLQKF